MKTATIMIEMKVQTIIIGTNFITSTIVERLVELYIFHVFFINDLDKLLHFLESTK